MSVRTTSPSLHPNLAGLSISCRDYGFIAYNIGGQVARSLPAAADDSACIGIVARDESVRGGGKVGRDLASCRSPSVRRVGAAEPEGTGFPGRIGWSVKGRRGHRDRLNAEVGCGLPAP